MNQKETNIVIELLTSIAKSLTKIANPVLVIPREPDSFKKYGYKETTCPNCELPIHDGQCAGIL